jgi:DNA-binding transcriptional MerR regulator
MEAATYTETTGVASRNSGISVASVQEYCRQGLLDHITLTNGMRLLRPGQEERIREIHAKGLANRGRKVPYGREADAA